MSISGSSFPSSTGVIFPLFKSPPRSIEDWEAKINDSVTNFDLKHTLLIRFWAPYIDKRSQAYELCESTLTDFYRHCGKTSWVVRRYIEKASFRREFLVLPREMLKRVLFNCRLLIGWLTPSWPQPILVPAELADAEEMLSQLTVLVETALKTTRISAFKPFVRVAEVVPERPTKQSWSFEFLDGRSRTLDGQRG